MTFLKKNSALLLATAFAGTMVVAVVKNTWVLFGERPYLEYRNIPFTMADPKLQVRPGQPVPIHVHKCSDSDTARTYLVTRVLQNVETGNLIPIPEDTRSTIQPGCVHKITLIHRVPVETPPGRYRILGVSEIRGQARTIAVEWHTETFTVIAK